MTDDPGDLYRQVADLSRDAHTHEGAAQVLRVVDDAWPQIAAREATPEDAEVCRLSMLAALQEQDHTSARVWRARALARFVAVGWHEGVASILMGLAFEELARANDDYSRGRTLDLIRPSAAALQIWDELARFVDGAGTGFALGPGSPSTAVLSRFFFEKGGFLRMLGQDWVGARLSYDRAAIAAAGHERGEVKVRLGRLLLDHLARGGEPDRTAADETEALAARAAAGGHEDLASLALGNSQVLRSGGGSLQPYEIL